MAIRAVPNALPPDVVEVQDEDVRKSDQKAGPLAPEDVQRIVQAALVDAIQYTDEMLSPARAKATDYYNGKMDDLKTEDGRSQVVSTDVRDAVASVLPSFLRVLFGPERVVEYVPTKAAAADAARQETDYVFHVFEEEQGGFLKTHAVAKDGLVKGIGIFKWWWQEEESRTETMENLTAPQVAALQQDSEVEVVEVTERPMPRRQTLTKMKQLVGLSPLDMPTYDVTVKRVDREGHPCIEAVPPEEFVFSRQARGLTNALCIAHRTEKRRGDLVAMGIPEDAIDEWGQRDTLLLDNPEEIARRDDVVALDPEAGEANDLILYCEAYIPLEMGSDGIARLHLVRTIGASYHVIGEPEEVDEPPFAVFVPDPEPHVMTGGSWADRTMDIQKTKSGVMRAMLDSASLSVFPRTAVVTNRVNLADVMNNEIGAVIRQDAPGMVQPLTVPFIGGEMLSVLGYFNDVVERRVGRHDAAGGLDADAMQSTTKEGVQAAITGSTEQIELLVRIFCEQAMKPLFRGLRKLFLQYQPRAKTVRLRGEWVDVDFRTWDANSDVTVNVALGSTMTAGRQAALGAILGKQEQVLSKLGVDQPLVSPAQYANTLRKMVETLGFKDTDNYFSAVPPDWKPAPQQPQQTPEQTLAAAQLQIEQMKVQKDMAIKQAELALKERQQQIDADLAVKKIASDEMLRLYQIDAQFKSSMTQAQLQADATAQENWLDAHAQGHEQAAQAHEAAQAQVEAEQQAAQQQAQPTEQPES